ncbi:hypothetical protein V8E53_008743 [Lactarius tabidus]
MKTKPWTKRKLISRLISRLTSAGSRGQKTTHPESKANCWLPQHVRAHQVGPTLQYHERGKWMEITWRRETTGRLPSHIDNLQNDGQWTIRSVKYQKYLGFESAPKDGTPIVGRDKPHLWDIEIQSADSEEDDNTRVKFWVRGTHLVVEYRKDRPDPEVQPLLRLWEARDGMNQVWVLRKCQPHLSEVGQLTRRPTRVLLGS